MRTAYTVGIRLALASSVGVRSQGYGSSVTVTHHPVSFYARSDQALGDAALRAKVYAATGRLLAGRQTGFAAFPAGDAVRDDAQRIRADVIAHLDEYLEQFAASVERRGGHVHWAATAADARRIVAEIAGAHGVRTAVKSKSMVSEEIELNPALERAGVRVVETDLGEWVVQLAGDHPSHIIAPIIHKSKEDVAALFRTALAATESDVADVPHMAALARRRLRAEFLRADMGVSGGNFGVAETGSLCLVTNEGNGRLTTTLPRVHVALMGIERIVPTLADLGVMLQVLARSATGQKLSVYSNIITGPRRRRGAFAGAAAEGEPDGPEELHIVLVDNGRSTLVGTELAEILHCIRCGACLNVCPVYRSIGGHAYGTVYPGPVGSVLTPALRGLAEFGELPHASSLCGACREICPVRIDLPRMLLALRARGTAEGRAPAWIRHGLWLYARLATRPRLFRAATRVGRGLVRFRAQDGWLSRMPGPLRGWTAHRDFPAPAARTFTADWRARARTRANVNLRMKMKRKNEEQKRD
jgi:L-lactate dehydrogenase complex protein LldF